MLLAFSINSIACIIADNEEASSVEYSDGLKKGVSAPNLLATFAISLQYHCTLLVGPF